MEDPSTGQREDRMAGLSLVTGAVLFAAIMTQDPTTRVDDAAARLEDLRAVTAGAGAVHAIILAVLALLLFGMLGLAGRLGMSSTRVRVGLIAWCANLAFVATGAVITGFVVPELARIFAGSTADHLTVFRGLLWLCRVSSVVLLKLGLASASVGLVAFGMALFGRNRAANPAAFAAGAVGILPPLAVAAGILHLDETGRLLLLFLQAAWVLWAGALLWRGQLEREAAATRPGAAAAA